MRISARRGWAPASVLALVALVGPWMMGTPETPTVAATAVQLLPPGSEVEHAELEGGGFVRAPALAPIADGIRVSSRWGDREIHGVHLGEVPRRRTLVLGSDHQGRDVAARLVAGARVSLTVAVLAALLSVALGSAAGLAGALGPRPIAETSRWLTDALLGLPRLLVLLALAVILRGSVLGIVLALSLVGWMDVSRVIEADARATLGRPFVEAASVAGSGRIRLAVRHVLPIAAPVLAAIVPVVVAEAVLLEATLAYLGVGASPSSWGTMVAEGQRMLSTAWWMAVVPGALVVLTALAVHGPVAARSRPATPVPW